MMFEVTGSCDHWLLHLKNPTLAFKILHFRIAGEFSVKYKSDGSSSNCKLLRTVAN